MNGKIKNFDILVSDYTKEIVGKIPPKFIIYGSTCIFICLMICLTIFSFFPIEKKITGEVILSKNHTSADAIFYTNALEISNEIRKNDIVKIYIKKDDVISGEYLIGVIDSTELIHSNNKYKSYLSLTEGLQTNKNNTIELNYELVCKGEILLSRENLIEKITRFNQ